MLGARPAAQEPGSVARLFKLSQTQGGRMPTLDPNDQLGRAIATLGDLDGNGVVDLATSGVGDDDGGSEQGAVHVLFLRADGRVIRSTKISALTGLTGLDPGDQVGRALCTLGDLDGDGVTDLAAGACKDDDGGEDRGAVWILFLRADGSLKACTKISQTAGGFGGRLSDLDEFGRSLACLGDLDGDGTLEVAVGAFLGGSGGLRPGVVWILSLAPDGSVAREVKVAPGLAGFTGQVDEFDWFGFALATLDDLDGDGVVELAVGAPRDDEGGVPHTGAVWILFLTPAGTVKGHRKLAGPRCGFDEALESFVHFGTALAALGDVDGDGVAELAVGAPRHDDGGTDQGAVYVLFLRTGGRVAAHRKLSAASGDLPPQTLDDLDWFGSALAPLGDLDRDGTPDVVIGARNDDDGGPNKGALYLTYLNGGARARAPRPGPGSAASGAAGPLAWRTLELAPTGSGLELSAVPGSPRALIVRAEAPVALAGRRARALLLATPLRRPGRGVPLLAAEVGPHAALELRLDVPRPERFLPLRLQVLWGDARGPLAASDALELRLRH
ncbi:MAG TPA: integrin alpha [Planctomycetota bacterium]